MTKDQTKEEEGFCTECGDNMMDRWPKIAAKLRICPSCSKKKVTQKTTYQFFGKHRNSSNLA